MLWTALFLCSTVSIRSIRKPIPEYVKALREMARSQMTEIVKELGTVGLPSILRIDTYFGILVGQNPHAAPPVAVRSG